MNINTYNPMYSQLAKSVSNQSQKIAFKGNYASKNDERSDLIKAIRIIEISGLLGIVGIAIFGKITFDEQKQIHQNFLEIASSDDIKKDTFEVKDVTGPCGKPDGIPDIILQKKDGTKAVYDFSVGKLKTKVNEIKCE